MAAAALESDRKGTEELQEKGDTEISGGMDAKKWFRENVVTSEGLDEIIDRDMFEFDGMIGLRDDELQTMAEKELKIQNSVMRGRFIKTVRELEAKQNGGIRRVILREDDPDKIKKMKGLKQMEKVDIVLLSSKECAVMDDLKKKKEKLDGMVAEWIKVGAKRERDWMAEKERMTNEFDAVMNALKMRRKEMIEKMDGIIGEDRKRVENGLNTSKQMAEETGLAMKEIDSLAKTAKISDEEREKRVEGIGDKIMGNQVDGKNLDAIKDERISIFRMSDKNELIERIQSCGEIIHYMQPVDLTLEKSLLKWKLPSEENDFKSDESIQYEIISNETESLGMTIQNQMKLDHFTPNHVYSIQVRARKSSKRPWGPFSKTLEIKMRPIDSLICADYELIPWLFKQIQSKIRRSSFSARMIYRASRDGWDAKDAHSRIDGKSPTFALMKNEFAHIYGGFTTVPWTTDGQDKTDENAFIFLLQGNESILKKYDVKTPRAFHVNPSHKGRAVNHASDHIVFFGQGHDLCARTNCHQSTNAYTAFPCSYQLGPSNTSSAKDHCDLMGGHADKTTQRDFKMTEIEWFVIE